MNNRTRLGKLARLPACAAFVILIGLIGALLSRAAMAVEIQRVVSPGGIEAWLVEQHTIPLIAMDFAFKGGTRLDPRGKEGLGNLLSGLLDEGAGELDAQAFQEQLQAHAIQLGFSIDRDSFRGSLQTLSEHRDKAFSLLTLALNEPRFDAEPIERIRAQILAGLAFEAEDPNQIASKAFFATAFPDHPYGRPNHGQPATVAMLTADDLRDFKARQFTTDRLFIGVVGDITATELATRLDSVFGELPAHADTDLAALPALQPATGQTAIIARDMPQTVMMFGMPGLLRKDPDFIPAYVMNYMLGGGGFTSRLTEEIREKRGLAYSVYSYLVPLDEAGLYLGGVATQNARAGETLDLIRAELERMRDHGVGEEELDNAKTYLIGSYPLRFDSNAKIAGQLLGIQMQDLGIDYFDKRNDLIAAVTQADIRRVAERLLDPRRLSLVAVGEPDGIAAPDAPALP